MKDIRVWWLRTSAIGTATNEAVVGMPPLCEDEMLADAETPGDTKKMNIMTIIMRTQGGAQTIANRAIGIVCSRAIHGGGGGGGPESGTEPGECSASFVEKHFPENEYLGC